MIINNLNRLLDTIQIYTEWYQKSELLFHSDKINNLNLSFQNICL